MFTGFSGDDNVSHSFEKKVKGGTLILNKSPIPCDIGII